MEYITWFSLILPNSFDGLNRIVITYFAILKEDRVRKPFMSVDRLWALFRLIGNIYNYDIKG